MKPLPNPLLRRGLMGRQFGMFIFLLPRPLGLGYEQESTLGFSPITF